MKPESARQCLLFSGWPVEWAERNCAAVLVSAALLRKPWRWISGKGLLSLALGYERLCCINEVILV